MLKDKSIVVVYLSGKMSTKNRIQVIIEDKVKVELLPYDLSKGFIIYRLNSKL
jgi:translation initiation factor IF-1